MSCPFQSTLPMKGATCEWVENDHHDRVSIHAPNEGSDRKLPTYSMPALSFQSTLPMKGATSGRLWSRAVIGVSIHAPNEGSDSKRSSMCMLQAFQSTLPMKGATNHAAIVCFDEDGVSIHAPNEGSDGTSTPLPAEAIVSIHAPNEGSDRNIWVKKYPYRQILVLLLLFYLQIF